jgi:hypothetical protein
MLKSFAGLLDSGEYFGMMMMDYYIMNAINCTAVWLLHSQYISILLLHLDFIGLQLILIL